ncbi:MAG: hypothetical protein HC844_20180 [Tabrizicola sp.]|nr:hypothetical protein [Tabrizicola sp.]
MANGDDHPVTAGADRIVISVDAMGGDRGPAAVVAGLAESIARSPGIAFILHGDEAVLKPLVARCGGDQHRSTIQNRRRLLEKLGLVTQVSNRGA